MGKFKNLLSKAMHPKRTIQERILNKKIIKTFGKNNNISPYVSYDSNTSIEGYAIIRSGSNLNGSKIGLGTLIGPDNNVSGAKIGRFCSFAKDVKIVSAVHPIDLVSSNVSFYNTCNQNIPFGKGEISVPEGLYTNNGFTAEIGHDVWIGVSVLIKGGVKIGNGAVIAMGSVVTKDVPPYAIVAGVPAKIIKYRFKEETIKSLLSINWWDWPEDLIRERRKDFSDVELFVKTYSPSNN